MIFPRANRTHRSHRHEINRKIGWAGFSLVFGLLLITLPGPPLVASDSDPKEELMLTDFTSDSPDLGWYTQNDNVMGGRSEGGFEQTPGELIFAGSTNTNGGGFSSIRTQPFKADLSKYEGIQLRVKGDGRRYTWQLQTNARWKGRPISYWADFETLADEWTTVNIPFSSFFPQFRGFKLDGPELDPGQITELGLYIYDKKDGPFELRLTGVNAYSKDAP
jgi:NADH dehydrogenase [ubiquinone] 1 alpha subcomplex assembly factor 1